MQQRRKTARVPEPARIQRKRTKGWKAPEGTIMCTRPGPWGNPFKPGINRDEHGRYWCVLGPGMGLRGLVCDDEPDAVATALDLFRGWLAKPERLMRFRSGFANAKFLACWCPVESPNCHVEIILETLRGA
jgi:hypothetical protein